jgi:hypothetical protein
MNSLVGANTSSFQSLRAQLFILVGDQVDAEGELVDVRTLSAKIEDTCRQLVCRDGRSTGLNIRIFGSGTPRLNRDLGYGYNIEYQFVVLLQCCVATGRREPSHLQKSLHASGKRPTHLILAVTVTSRGSSRHLEVFRGGFRVLLW